MRVALLLWTLAGAACAAASQTTWHLHWMAPFFRFVPLCCFCLGVGRNDFHLIACSTVEEGIARKPLRLPRAWPKLA